jgi:phosphoglycerol transferase MdoB-like AlkP superfamily enzyme
MKELANLALAYAILAIIVLAIFHGYYKLSCNHWSDLCVTSLTLYIFEFPVLFLLGLLFYVPGQKLIWNVLASLAATLPLITFYVVFDVFYNFRYRAMRFFDIGEIRVLWDFSPITFIGLIIVTAAAIFPSVLLLVKRIKERGISIVVIVLRSVMTLAIIFLVFTPVAAVPYQGRFLNFVEWSDHENIDVNGRLSSVVYYSNKNSAVARNLANLDTETVRNPLSLQTANWKKRNVHIVVLESFMDPRYLKEVSFTRDPLYEKMPQFLGSSHFNIAVSPVFGGDTATAEFEIICGAPSLGKINTIEFNVFNGRKVKSLVTTLKEYGYSSVASIGTSPIFFNSIKAYQSLGFDELHFLDTGDIYNKIGQGEFVFDGDLLEQNLEFIGSRYIASGRPFINYVVGFYGHWDYSSDPERHPDILTARIKGHPSEDINKISNQFYYRTEAIYNFLAKLRQVDPGGIILIIADHLPAVLSKDVQYSMDYHENIFVLFNGRTRYTPPNRMRYYEFPYQIMSLLSRTKVKVPNSHDLEDLYFDILATGNKTE